MSIIAGMAAQGRNGDTRMAHMTPGERVIPREVAALRPDLVAHVAQAIAQMGGDPSKYTVGAGRRNPATGAEEFASQDEIIAAYQKQLNRAPGQGEIDYWANNDAGFTGGSFQQGVVAERASTAAANPAPSFTDYGGTQVRNDAGFKSYLDEGAAMSNKATGGNETAEQYDKRLNPDTYGARWGGVANPASAPAPASGGGIVSGAAQLGAPTPWTVTPEQTVEDRIRKIIDPNSPLTQQVATDSLKQSNARGLINSSIAIGNAQDAVIRNATPIAAADAATYAKAAGYNADQNNQFATKNTDYQNTFGLAELNNASSEKIAKMNVESQAQAAKIQQANTTLLQTNSNAAQAFNTAASAINNIQNNPQMDEGAKTRAVANAWHDLETQLRVIGSVAGLDLTSKLNFAGYPGYDANGKWIGFPAAAAETPAPAPATPGGTTAESGA